MLTAFFDIRGLLQLEFKKLGVSINAQRYTQTLDKPHKDIKNKRPGLLLSSIIVLNDNERSHVTKVCVEALARKKGEFLEQSKFSLQSKSVDLKLLHLWTAEEKPNGSTISLRR
ncbi:hypothetical protein TNCV_4106631 [Trichonephila clavipes]|nr:hypothetical protein TNCV_4106631 [Trichonephila clavipes]